MNYQHVFFQKMLPRLRQYQFHLLLILGFVLIDVVFNLLIPISFQLIIDRTLIAKDLDFLWFILMVLSVSFVISGFVSLWRSYLSAIVVSRFMNDIRVVMFNHLQRLSMKFYLHNDSGKLMSRFTNDLKAIEEAIIQLLEKAIFMSLSIVICVLLLFYLEWHLALLTLILLPLSVIATQFLAPKATSANYQKKQHEADVAGEIQENINTHKMIRSLNLQKNQFFNLKKQLSVLYTKSLSAHFWNIITQNISILLANFILVVLIGIGSFLVIRGFLSQGELVGFLGVLMVLVGCIVGLVDLLPILISGFSGIQRVGELLAEEIEITDQPNALSLPKFKNEICFANVDFSYTGEKSTLRRINFTISANQSIAFVGTTGSGKSTIVNLLARFYETNQGKIVIDGYNLREIKQDSFLAQIAIVFQDNILFNSSIRNNIDFGNATDEQIIEAAKAAEIHDFILTLPQGYDTQVGEGGSNLSGGQRQRIALARAFLRNPSILILDEATSALDSETEFAINETLKRLASGRTVISITHRLSSVINYDKIFVLKDGEIVEQGNHEALLKLDGTYKQLWQKQNGFIFNQTNGQVTVETEWLQTISTLNHLKLSILNEIASLFTTTHMAEEKIVVREGDQGDCVYIIARGSVAVFQTLESGEQMQIKVLTDGDYFGEVALFKNIPRIATIKTITPCILLSLTRWQFWYCLDKYPGIDKRIKKRIAKY